MQPAGSPGQGRASIYSHALLPFFQAHCIFFSKRKKKKKKRSTLHPEIKQWTNIGMANVTWNVARCHVPHPGNIVPGTGRQEHFHPRFMKTFSPFPFHISRSNRPGSSASMGMASCNANVPERASDFHRTVWGDFFINYSSEPLQAWVSIFTDMMQRESMRVYVSFSFVFQLCMTWRC
jgi:hypothetical protein